MSQHEASAGNRQVSPAETPSTTGLLTLAVGVVIIAALYFARDVLVPITLAVLLSFVLAPFVRLLRWVRLPRAPAALIAIVLALAVILSLGGVIGAQVASLAQDLPRYETTIRQKVEAVRAATIGRITALVERFDELRAGGGSEGASSRARSDAAPAARNPAAQQPSGAPSGASGGDGNEASSALSPFTILGSFLPPVLSPIATLGIVLVIALFILLQQDDLRDRFIRLLGARDLHRTTEALNEGVRRLSRYFLMQLALNSAFGVVVTIGLYFVGLPSPLLWGLLAGLCRFIPYVGAFIAAAPPLIVAAAVDPGWSMFVATAALFAVTEPVMGQVVEPLVYGHSTGLTPVSVVIAAIFWTWLWGPIGLILATPLTLCLVVLGRHVDRLEFLDVLLGDRPALSPTESFYQRMLAGDPDEVQDQADVLLRTRSLSAYYDEVALPGLKLAARDASRGALAMPQLMRIRDSVQELVDELDEYDDVEPPPPKKTDQPLAPMQPPSEAPPARSTPSGHAPRGEEGAAVLCMAGVNPLDEAAAEMLAQLLGKHGLAARRLPGDRAARSVIAALNPSEVAVVCISAIETSGNAGRLRLLVRRLRRRLPATPILVGLWPAEPAAERGDIRSDIGADRCIVSLAQAVRVCLDIAWRAAASDERREQDQKEATGREIAPGDAARLLRAPAAIAEAG
jgi:predicted PurR-regulated permease PerM